MNKLILLLIIPFLIFSQCEENEYSIVIETATGNWGYEMCWSIYDYQTYVSGPSNDNSIATYCGIDNYQTTLIETCILNTGCYIITATDSWGDGWNGGDITISVNNENPQVYEMIDGSNEYWTFELNSDPCTWEILGCTNSNAINYNPGATIDDGSCVVPNFFNWDNEERQYWLYVPEDLPDNAPLVFVLHGYGGTGGSFFGFEDLAEEYGFIVCSPTGLVDNFGVPHWNSNFVTYMTTVDDIGFLSALAIQLQSEYNLDSNKTFACGMSNGGYMSWSLACNAPEVFKAIASVTGTMSGNDWEQCAPTSYIPVMQISGTADNIVPVDGYPEDAFDFEEWGGAPDIYTILDFWSNLEDCMNLNTVTVQFDYMTDITFYTNCVNNNELRLYVANGMGHSWPSFATDEIWNFFYSATNNLSVQEHPNRNNFLIKTIDILGRNSKRAGFNINIYDNGSVKKTYKP